MVDRYSPIGIGCYYCGGDLHYKSDGDWVTIQDYTALEKKYAALVKKVKTSFIDYCPSIEVEECNSYREEKNGCDQCRKDWFFGEE